MKQAISATLVCALGAVAVAPGCGDSDTSGPGGGSSTTTAVTSTSSGSSDCDLPTDCADPGNECIARVCLDHKCGTLAAAFGTPAHTQTDGDCKRSVCDGSGALTSLDDADDVVADAIECTEDVCAAGSPSHAPKPLGTSCSAGVGFFCDGTGACVACVDATDCNGSAICSNGLCVPPTCADGTKNGSETDMDCGGDCAPCALSKACVVNDDCTSGLCAADVCADTNPIITEISATGHDRFFNLAFDAQGNILAVGVAAPATDATTDYATIVAKFSPQGVLDTTFGTAGVFMKNLTVGANGELARAIGLQSTGKIVVAATVDHVGAVDARDRDVAVFRLMPDGTLDTTFGTAGVAIFNLSDGVLVGNAFIADSVWHLVVQPDDKIAFTGGQVRPGGTDTDYAMVRLTPDGALDTTFGTGGKVLLDINNVNASARSITLLPDGSLLGAGYMDLAGVGTPVLYKVNASGAFDATFGTGGYFNAVVLAAQTEAYSAQPQGAKLVTTGYGRANATTESLDWISLRFLANGTLDPTYGTNGVARIDIAGFNDNSRQIAVLPDGRVVLAGGGRWSSSDVDGAVGVLTPNGQPDTTFSPTGVRRIELGGPNDFLWGMAVSPGKDYLALAGIRGIATGGVGDDDTALVLVPLH